MLPHLHNGWQVDQAILSEEDRVVVIRFGHDWDPTCMKMDEVLYSIAEKVTQPGRCAWHSGSASVAVGSLRLACRQSFRVRSHVRPGSLFTPSFLTRSPFSRDAVRISFCLLLGEVPSTFWF